MKTLVTLPIAGLIFNAVEVVDTFSGRCTRLPLVPSGSWTGRFARIFGSSFTLLIVVPMHVGLLHSIVPWPESQRSLCPVTGNLGNRKKVKGNHVTQALTEREP